MRESKVSLKARKELLIKVRDKYKNAGWKEKVEILNGFIASTGYQRKYAIMLLNSESSKKAMRTNKRKKQPISDIYTPVMNARLYLAKIFKTIYLWYFCIIISFHNYILLSLFFILF